MLYKLQHNWIFFLSLIVTFIVSGISCHQEKKNAPILLYPRSNAMGFNHPYLNKADCFYRNNFDSAIFYYKEAVKQFQKEGIWEGETRAFNLIGSCFSIKRLNDSALHYLLLGKKVADQHLSPNNITRFRNNYYLGICYGDLLEPGKALVYFQTCEDLLKNYFILHHSAWADVYKALGDLYASDNIHKAEEYYIKAFNANYLLHAPTAELADNFYSLASISRKKGDYFRALQFNKLAFNYFKKANLNSYYLANCYVAEGNIYHDMDSAIASLESYRKAIHLKKKSDNINWEIYFNDLAAGFIKAGQTDSAKFYARKSFGYNPLYKAPNWFIIGQAFCEEKQWDSSEFYYKKCLHIEPESFETIFHLGKLYSEEGKSDSALYYFQRALCLSVKRFRAVGNPLVNPIDTLIKEGNVDLMELFYAKGLEFENKYNRDSRDKISLKMAFECYVLADHVIDLNRKSYHEKESKLFLVSSFRKVYDHAINCAYTLSQLFPEEKYVVSIFDIMEKTKYALLLEDLFEAGKNKSALLFNAIGQEEKKAMRTNQYTLGLDRTQGLLKNNQEIVEYYWGDKAVFAMGITKKKVIVHKIENKDTLENAIRSYVHLLKEDSQNPDAAAQLTQFKYYAHVSCYLYTHLIEKVLLKDILETPENEPTLIITPDGQLSFIPFEPLTTRETATCQEVNYKTLSYLIKQYHVTYSYSSTILFGYLKKRGNEIKTKPLFLGLFNGDAKNLLTDSIHKKNISSSGDKDFQDIAQSIGQYNIATFKNLVNLSPAADVIQLNIHGLADKKNPSLNKLILTDKDLYFSTVLNMDFRNKIMLLTACETGAGIHYKGEGVYSLARAFIYAGSSAVVMSLWRVPEHGTLSLMKDFYAALFSGKSADLSLTIAKRNYIDKCDNQMANPCYWAGLVSVGNLKPVYCTFQSGYKNTVLTIGIILGLSIILYVWSTRFYDIPRRS